jgi:transcriptional regulator with XRE-family HTH domain
MAKGRYDPTTPAEVGRRLALTRRALEYTTTTMCRLMGSISHGSTYSNYESGIRLISIQHALKLCRRCRLTLAWIYQGDFKSLPPDIQEKIVAHMLPGDVQHTTRKARVSGG